MSVWNTSQLERQGPLAGVRVVDLTRMVMGPYATQILADQGADVVAFEPPGGDAIRNAAGPIRGLSGIALNLMRGKRSVVLDLTSSQAHDAVLEVISEADVVITNMRPKALEKLGLDYASVKAVQPNVIYCQGQGWPLGSGRENEPAYDDVIQAATGAADLEVRVTGTAGLLPTLIADKVAGLFMAQAVSAALVHRAVTGEGQHVEVPMITALTSFTLLEHGSGATTVPPLAAAGYARILTPERRPAQTTDGWVQVLPYTPDQFRALFTELDRPDLVGGGRLETMATLIASSDSLYRDVRESVAHLSTSELLEVCARLDIPVSPVATLEELLSNMETAQHPDAGKYRVLPHPIRFDATPAAPLAPAPLLGQHTKDFVAEYAARVRP